MDPRRAPPRAHFDFPTAQLSLGIDDQPPTSCPISSTTVSGWTRSECASAICRVLADVVADAVVEMFRAGQGLARVRSPGRGTPTSSSGCHKARVAPTNSGRQNRSRVFQIGETRQEGRSDVARGDAIRHYRRSRVGERRIEEHRASTRRPKIDKLC